MVKGEKTNLYLLSIVAIVAVVGIVVMILNASAGSISLSSDDLTGEAQAAAPLREITRTDQCSTFCSRCVSSGGTCERNEESCLCIKR